MDHATKSFKSFNSFTSLKSPIAFLLFVDPKPPDNAPPKPYSLTVRILGALSRTFQSWPGMLHTELLFVMSDGKCHHFSTYIESNANWRQTDSYYAQNRWHALPIAIGAEVQTLVARCNECRNAPYSIWRYILSTSTLGWLAHLVQDQPTSPAHCGGLMARALHDVRHLQWLSPQYSPSSLYATTAAQLKAHPLRGGGSGIVHSLGGAHPSMIERNPLLTSSDDQLRMLSGSERLEHLLEYVDHVSEEMRRPQPREASLVWSERLGWIVSRLIQLQLVDAVDPHASPSNDSLESESVPVDGSRVCNAADVPCVPYDTTI